VPDGICVTGHGPSLTRSTVRGLPVRPAMTWLDSRAATEAGELEAATGLRGWALGVLPAARWLERHEPERPPARAGTSTRGRRSRCG
jgi:sugar (pentulose or hexulose) kinase